MPWLEIAISAVVGILLGSLSVMFYYRRGLSAQQKQLQEDALKVGLLLAKTDDLHTLTDEGSQQLGELRVVAVEFK